MKKRVEARIQKSLLVDISRRGFQQMGVTVNISRRGMFVATTEAFRKRSRLQILIAADDQIYALSGIVVWKMKRTTIPGQDVPVGLGIRIETANPAYSRYVAAIKRNSVPVSPGSRAC
jgi:hypothetical protein